jgi:TPP-dependent pyruvate/acetoin dehydrogenase alpha subunit
MDTGHTVETLKAFEADIVAKFNAGKIKAPVHLGGGNEQTLIDIFDNIKENDWVGGTWRSHLHCLLKGVPPEELKAAILEGRSIALCFPQQRVICSAMVGGIVPVALGLAWAAKRDGKGDKVYCFIGDMAAMSGIVHECTRYARGHDLPLVVIVEDNGKSVATDTKAVWGGNHDINVRRYHYELSYPHVGSGRWVHMQ